MISDLNKCAWGLFTLSVMPQNPFLLIIWLILGQAGYFCTRPRRNTIISVPIALIGNIHYRRLRTVISPKPFLRPKNAINLALKTILLKNTIIENWQNIFASILILQNQ